MKNKHLILIFLLLSSLTLRAQFKFLPDEYSDIVTASEIKSAGAWPNLITNVDQWDYMHGHSSTWGSLYLFKSVRDVIKVGVNLNSGFITPAYKYKVAINIYKYHPGAIYLPPGKPTPETIVLYLTYDPASREIFTDLSIHSFSGFLKFESEISGVYPELPSGGYSSTSLPVTSIASNFYLENEIHAQRYDLTTVYLLPNNASLSTDTRSLKVSSYLHSSPSGSPYHSGVITEYKPAAYELEWTYIDDYQVNMSTGAKSYKFDSNPVNYDFRKNSTRVQLDHPSYNIPLIYEHGAIVFRFRMLRPKLHDYKTIEYGPWTLSDYGTLSPSSSFMPFDKYAYLIQAPHTNDSLNWQYTVNFAEQGKYKHVINYFDGSLKDRQTQTKINSNNNNIVAVEKVYDYEGRPSIVSLPTPVSQENLYYRNDILTHFTTNKPYKASDFDLIGCARPGFIDSLANTAAAKIYYSPLNPVKTGMQKFVPNAEGYPLVHTVYSPDNTNKVEWQGGAGIEQQLDKGHGTRYEYVRAIQPELDKFLGTEAGYNRYYPKQIVTDPNGQSSYSILNPQGKVVISALQSASPDPLKSPIDPLSNFVPGQEVCTDLLRNEEQEKLKNGTEFYTTFYNDGAGSNTLTYSVKTFPFFTSCSNQYLWAQGNYSINVTDECGKKYPLLCTTGSVENPTLALTALGVSTPSDPAHAPGHAYKKTSPVLSDPSVPQGKILIDKKITFSEYDIRNQVRGFVKANEPICFSPEAFFIRNAIEATQFPCKDPLNDPDGTRDDCDRLKEQMMKDLWPRAKYGQFEENGDHTFKDEKPNSIFTIVGKDIVTPSDADGVAYVNGIFEKCDVVCSTSPTTCDSEHDRCGCVDGAHTYPDNCCNSCLINLCKCIKFPTAYRLTPILVTVMKPALCSLDRSTLYYVKTGEFSYLGGLYKEERYDAKMYCNCTMLHSTSTEWKQKILGLDISKVIETTERFFGSMEGLEGRLYLSSRHTCSTAVKEMGYEKTFIYNVGGKPFAVDPKYRYQSDCGITLPSEVWHKGKRYTDLANLDPQTFIEIFNKDIAEALLPLHPEYCRLLNCKAATGAFDKQFDELETFQQAEAAGLFNLDDIVNADPLPVMLAGGSTASTADKEKFKNAFKIPFKSDRAVYGISPIPSDVMKLDKSAITKVYCDAGNYEEMLVCANGMYASQISGMSLPTNDLKQRYFETLKALYIGNRSIIKQYNLDRLNTSTSCAPCDKFRMTQQGDPVFPPFIAFGSKPIGSDEKGMLDDLPEWKRLMYIEAMDHGTISSIPPEMAAEQAAEREALAEAEAEQIKVALADCPVAVDKVALKTLLKNKILEGIQLTPDIIKNAIGVSNLNELCHPFLVSYGVYPNNKAIKMQTSDFACGDPSLLNGLQDFLNRPQIIDVLKTADASPGYTRSTTFTLSSTNTFENAIISAASATSIFVDATLHHVNPSCASSCLDYVQLKINGSSSLYINIQARNASPTSDIKNFANSVTSPDTWAFQNTKCLNEDVSASTAGLITQKTALVEASKVVFSATTLAPNQYYYVWNNFVNLMTAAPDAASLAQAITCIDIEREINNFKTDKATYAYQDWANHLHYEQVITNYLNYKFNKSYTYYQYEDLMNGCALGDRLILPKSIAHARLVFNSDADVETFITQINALGANKPIIFRYKGKSSGDKPTVYVDLAPINNPQLALYRNYLNGTGSPSISGLVSRDVPYYTSANDNVLFVSTSCTIPSTLLPSGTAGTTSSSSVEVWENESTPRDYTMYQFSLASSATPKDHADLHSAVKSYLNSTTAAGSDCNGAYAFWSFEAPRSNDYSNPLRQSYLNYVYGLSSTIKSSPSALRAAIDPATLATAGVLGSSTFGSNFTYNNPYVIGNRLHLYGFTPTPSSYLLVSGYYKLKNYIISKVLTGTTNPFPNADVTVRTVPTGESLIIYRKANGVYWYRYFDANHAMYNIYIVPPSKAYAKDIHSYTSSISNISMGQHSRTFNFTVSSGTVTVQCQGYTDFDLLPTNIAQNLILDNNPKGTFAFDSIDCERELLNTAILNGKEAYIKYFEENVARISNDYMNHLVNTTKDTLIYCGRQQQYQQTLYYYDLVGNLIRTVPPMGVNPLPAVTSSTSVSVPGSPGSGLPTFGMDVVDKYRDDPAQYFKDITYYPPGGGPAMLSAGNLKLTNHRKVSEYQYNSLNQLIYQKTPDGGVTHFFYDAAGRQIFSQNSKQRKTGDYTYSLYDEQGRPEESGQIRIGCKYATDEEVLSNIPCETYFLRKKPDGTYETIASYGAHPDYVINSYDEKKYPYQELKQYIRSQSRQEVVFTHYDNMSKDLGTIPDEMLSTQENLRARVESIRYFSFLSPDWVYTPSRDYDSYTDATFTTYYSYDPSGNVQTITYDYPELKDSYKQRFKRIDYDYDLVSGKVNMISYNRGFSDQFYQQYDYDADNRITEVKTSNDGLIWNSDAQYEYYKHGPLATLKLGEHQIQSIEYAYTIQGWLKAINGDVLDPNKDMGTNGLSADMTYPRDVIAHALRYFEKDYKPIGTTAVTHLPSSGGAGGGSLPPSGGAGGGLNLYNGNISHQTTGIEGHGTMQRTYQYDQLQRLKLATNSMVDDATAALASTSPANLFKSSYSYDMDGNITNLARWDGNATTPVQIDNFTYKYENPAIPTALNNNKLLQVEDLAGPIPPPPGGLGGADLQPGQPTDNYKYDLIGNLIRDKQGAEHILWDRFGKVKSIVDTVEHRYIDFAYDGKGNRIWKLVRTPVIGGRDEYNGEYYVRDAGGNILSVYRTRSVYNRRETIRPYVAAAAGATSTTTPGGTILTEVLSTYTSTLYPTLLRSKMLEAHSAWVDTYTDKPISFYWQADPTLKSNLLFSSDTWIDALRSSNPSLHRDALLNAKKEVEPLFYSALDHHSEGPALLELYSQHMPPGTTEEIWSRMEASYHPTDHHANADALFNSLAQDPNKKPMLVEDLVKAIARNHADTLPEAANFYSAVVASDSLWQSPRLRTQNGAWTAGISNIVSMFAPDTTLRDFFDTWPAASPIFAGIATPEYKLDKVYGINPTGAITDMSKIASIDEITDILTSMPEVSYKLLRDDISATDHERIIDLESLTQFFASSGDYISLAEHHLYGSSRLGVQKYESNTIANILNLPPPDEALVRTTLRNRQPWYSYPFADLIDSTKRSPYLTGSLTGNAYLGEWKTSRTLGRKYYEMTDHLGNVLATVLDRKTGAGTKPSDPSLYDHWSADLASTADYYPGGMMMPGRNTEYSWSRMGYNGQAKTDEVYGKGNLNTALFWEMDTRIIRRWNLDPVDQISISNYAVFGNNSIMNVDVNGDVIDPWYKKSSQKDFTIPGNGGLRSNFKSFINQESLTNFGASVLNLASTNKIFAQVYNQLSTSKTHYKVQQYNETSVSAAAQYIPALKEVKLFYFGASDDAIFEEFLHAGQDDYYSKQGMQRSSLADEVEAKAANLVSGYQDASAKKNNYSSITTYFKTGKKDKDYDKQVGQLVDEVYDSYSKANGEEWTKNNPKSSVDKKSVFKYLETMTTKKESK